MKYGARKFVQESYNENDVFAKLLFSAYISAKNHCIKSIEENYYHDIVTEKDGDDYYFELEVKHNYPFTSSDTFKFDTVSFLGRKKRLHDIQPFYYIIVCAETEWAISCHSNDIYEESNIEELDINTSHRTGKDLMYRVDKIKCKFFNLNKHN